MLLRLMSALYIVLLAGCTSSEPQKASYAPPAGGPSQAAPLVAAPAPQAAPVTGAPALHAAPPMAHAASPVPAVQNQPSAFPTSDAAGMPQADPAAAAALPPGATNCSTVDGVTLCDAPTEFGSDDPSADAYDADETLNTN